MDGILDAAQKIVDGRSSSEAGVSAVIEIVENAKLIVASRTRRIQSKRVGPSFRLNTFLIRSCDVMITWGRVTISSMLLSRIYPRKPKSSRA